MSCHNRDIQFDHTTQDDSLTLRYFNVKGAVVVPVFCCCMISALGALAGIRHVVSMQFDVDADTEYIQTINAEHFYARYLNIENIN